MTACPQRRIDRMAQNSILQCRKTEARNRSIMSKSSTPKVAAKTRAAHRKSTSKVGAKKADATHRKPVPQIAAKKVSNTPRCGTHRKVATKFQEFRATQKPHAMPA